ncbi:hypothetical protein [Streptomyces paradoxus]|uniref:hypothetical protein n=1 Tax=Streptomyces paradoxus TaxID=66375 RepID=UPI0038038DBE
MLHQFLHRMTFVIIFGRARHASSGSGRSTGVGSFFGRIVGYHSDQTGPSAYAQAFMTAGPLSADTTEEVSTKMSDHGSVARQGSRVTVPSPGCLAAIMLPIFAVLIVASVLMVMQYRQERANERNEAEALHRTAALARSHARDVVAAPDGFPGREAVRGIAERHDGRLIAYARSEGSLSTTVRFLGEYEDTSMFGVSRSRAYRCYSVVLRKRTEDVPQVRTTPLEKCDVI